jgi:phosphoribosylanthranilate isomerase
MTIVKICGITNTEDALAALDAGAHLLGFVFYPKSPRYVSVETVTKIIKEIREWRLQEDALLPPHSISHSPRFVGLFVNESPTRIAEILQHTHLDYAQFHGDEPPEAIARFSNRAFRAIRPTSDEEALAQAQQFHSSQFEFGREDHDSQTVSKAPDLHLPRLLIDAYAPNAYGGTGTKADWHAAAEVVKRFPHTLLAGGLTPENVADAITIVHPWGVDVSSGVESSPGKKDHNKIQDFIQMANRYTP